MCSKIRAPLIVSLVHGRGTERRDELGVQHLATGRLLRVHAKSLTAVSYTHLDVYKRQLQSQ